MTTNPECPRYKFKSPGMDFERYFEGRMTSAKSMRIEAQILIARADVIENECANLKLCLVKDAPDEE